MKEIFQKIHIYQLMHLFFFCESSRQAKLFRNLLLKEGINTKILPEACTWHFSKYWEHMKINRYGLTNSEKLLNRCVSLPVLIKK